MPEAVRKVLRRRVIRPVGENHEAERSLWGPHPDPALACLEDELYQVGFRFLAELHGAAWGVNPPRNLQKAFGGMVPTKLPGWGEVASWFRRKDVSPMELRSGWADVIDRLVGALFNQRTREEAAAAVAVKCHWLGRIRALTEGQGRLDDHGPLPRSWNDAAARMKRQEVEAMEWTKARALERMTDLSTDARSGLMNTLVQARQEGLGSREVQRRCYDRFGDLNRDWRRVALTETAAATSNGQLASVDPAEGWEAVWVSCRGGCEWCMKWNGKVFRVVSPDMPGKDGQTQVWAGKTNHGRHGAKKARDGRIRGLNELWWPCIPVHPNCGCSFVLRKIRRR